MNKPIDMKTSSTLHRWSLCALASLSLALASQSQAAERKLTALAVYPPNVQLTTQRDHQALVVQASYEDGITEDVTMQSKFTLANPSLVKLNQPLLLPAADGTTELTVEFGGQMVKVPVEVKSATVERPISFKLDVMPVFSRAGCNTGSCHGAARGKDGFRLSLYGFDVDGDYQRITREINGRRINLALPNESLLLDKSAGRVTHSGGKRFDADSPLYHTTLRWLEAGAPADVKEVADVTGVEIYPKNAVLNGPGAEQRLTVRATYSDGTNRDVTSLSYMMTSNENSANVTPEGVITAGERGEAFLMARFSTFTVGMHVIVLPKDLKFDFPPVAEHNYIDQLTHAKLKKLRITPSAICTDEVFLRRAYLDIVGLLPTVEEYQKFMDNPSAKKRDELVDELLGRKEFVELWVMKWAELLQIKTSNQVTAKSMLLYFNWLQDKIANNVPMDIMVKELLGSNGGTFGSPATNYYQNERDTLKTSENVAQVFMGMRIQCAQCHNHPFDQWTMNDYYSFAAFFSQIGRKPAEDPRELVIFNTGRGDIRNPVTNQVMAPKFLGGAVPDVKDKDRREVMANWLASPDNPYFATNLGNMVWAHFMGRGIIDEVDDVRVSNPAVNQELLVELGRKFTEYRYDFKKLVRDICTSRTYQLATQTNETNESDTTNFSHASLRRIRAEILLDLLTQVTDTKEKFSGLPLGARAVQVADGRTSNYFLTTFGRATRETVCSCEVKMEPNLSQALHLMNGDTVTRKMQQGALLDRRLKEGKKPEEIVEEMYIRCLTRRPTETEWTALKEVLTSGPNPKSGLEDIYWALLNSREFLFNH